MNSPGELMTTAPEISDIQQPANLAPVDSEGRIHTLDILRGLALFAMILVHFHQKMRLEVTGPEDLIGWGVWIFVEQKAWGIFAFLFGVGFAVLLRRLEARGAAVVPIYLRRLAMLGVFGIVAQVGFGFQILLSYACWGLALLVVRRWSTRALLLTAVFAACAQPVVAELTALHGWWIGSAAAAPAGDPLREAVAAAALQGSYSALLAARWAFFLGSFPHTWRDLLPDTNLALFIIGLLAVRYRVLDEPKRHVRTITGWMTFGAVAWAGHWVLWNLVHTSIPDADWPLQSGFGILQDQWLCFAYIGAVVLLLAYHPDWTLRLRLFGQAGRMALTNYLLQAMVLDFLASGYGLSLKVRPLLYLPAALVLFGVEAIFSQVWLERYRFGPLEWLWRTVTYARPQPLRRRELSLSDSI